MRMNRTIDFPHGWPVLPDDLMSNIDHEIDANVAEQMRSIQALATYPGWNFNAICWWDGERGQYLAAVYQFKRLTATYIAPSPLELMRDICRNFGSH